MPSVSDYNKILTSLRSERSSFIPVYQELSDYHLAYRGRFLTSQRNKGHKRNTKQLNNTSRLSVRALSSGMMAGTTSPSRPWFKLSSGDTDLDKFTSVKEWLYDVETTLYKIFSASNIYTSLHQVYEEEGVFGTAPLGVFKNFDNVIHTRPYTVGSYMIATNPDDKVDTFYREYEWPVGRVVQKFGFENCSTAVQNNYKSKNYHAWVKLVHVIEPNMDMKPGSKLARDMAYSSVYYEADSNKNQELLRSGFKRFPIPVARWGVAGEDIYATDCPGMTALGDAKGMQLGEKLRYRVAEIMADPPTQGDTNLRNHVTEGGIDPGDNIWGDMTGGGIKTVYGNFSPDMSGMSQLNLEAEDRIRRAFYEDLFLMLANSPRGQTATEVAEKHEEKILMLGPMLERNQTDLHEPIIDITFDYAQEEGILPPPPPELQGKKLEVEHTSLLAQAMKLVGVTGLERVTGFTANLTAVWPEARHKVNPGELIDEYADRVGVNPSVLRGEDEYREAVSAEQQAAVAAQAQEATAQAADTAKVASEIPLDDGNVLDTILQNAGIR